MSVSIEAVGDHTAKHGGKLLKNKKFLMIAGGVAVLGVVVYFRKKNAASTADTAAFSNYPIAPQDTGSVPSNIGSSTGTYDPTSATNDPYSTDLGNSQAPLMTPVMYQPPIANIPQQQNESGTITKAGVAPGGFEVMTGDQYNQQGNKVTVTDALNGVGTYDTQSHNYTWDYSHETVPNAGYTPPAGTTANFSTILKSDGSINTPQAVGLDNNKIGSDGLTDYTRAAKAALLANGGTNYSSPSPAQPATVSHSSSSSSSSSSSHSSNSSSSSNSSKSSSFSSSVNSSDMSSYRTPATASASQKALAAKYGMSL